MTSITLKQLAKFNSDVTEEKMQSIFGKNLGSHVWESFVQNNYQLMLWKFDYTNMERISFYINENYPDETR